ncbi:MAG: 1-(5-phosphoribosyl)-5-((5-phosphoribosylamino)methylideneamino)imidazole-4-carboxamide isomerase [Candidatus Dormibacteraeota bacterium]|nr:1-(5-phosphoribosyl)-5-((5-phosphoribosylamino)methylideneamino)imidazole-4-carboxamide isomerase [Candidatus Dormibacteraeota bacterium]MBV9524837.1 1-(5-phosphoribosyl)-5-((5-phosphoribosylamino)methylideneamino)imidazole-4-carboxamide isomerase [Candidatus Dormibacteraeota bacterium]
MEVIPAVDLLGGDAVRLFRGNFEHATWRRPAEDHVDRLVQAGARRIHLVDLDGAREGSIRLDVVSRLLARASPARVQVAGGVRDSETVRELLDAGADRVIIGTAAFESAQSLPAFVRVAGDRLVVAIDVRNGRVTVRGWQSDTGLTVDEAMGRCRAAGVTRVLCTSVERDGTLHGPDLELLRAVVDWGIPAMAAGGIRSAADIDALAALGCEAAIVGTAVITHPEALLT